MRLATLSTALLMRIPQRFESTLRNTRHVGFAAAVSTALVAIGIFDIELETPLEPLQPAAAIALIGLASYVTRPPESESPGQHDGYAGR